MLTHPIRGLLTRRRGRSRAGGRPSLSETAPDFRYTTSGERRTGGGIKTRHMGQDNQQVAETTDRRVPSSPFDSPSLPPNLPPAIGETAVVLGPARNTTSYLQLSANLRRPTAPCHITPVRPQAHQRVARNDPKESRKVALRLITQGRSTGAPNAPALAPIRLSL
jgi:hypothetical protein